MSRYINDEESRRAYAQKRMQQYQQRTESQDQERAERKKYAQQRNLQYSMKILQDQSSIDEAVSAFDGEKYLTEDQIANYQKRFEKYRYAADTVAASRDAGNPGITDETYQNLSDFSKNMSDMYDAAEENKKYFSQFEDENAFYLYKNYGEKINSRAEASEALRKVEKNGETYQGEKKYLKELRDSITTQEEWDQLIANRDEQISGMTLEHAVYDMHTWKTKSGKVYSSEEEYLQAEKDARNDRAALVEKKNAYRELGFEEKYRDVDLSSRSAAQAVIDTAKQNGAGKEELQWLENKRDGVTTSEEWQEELNRLYTEKASLTTKGQTEAVTDDILNAAYIEQAMGDIAPFRSNDSGVDRENAEKRYQENLEKTTRVWQRAMTKQELAASGGASEPDAVVPVELEGEETRYLTRERIASDRVLQDLLGTDENGRMRISAANGISSTGKNTDEIEAALQSTREKYAAARDSERRDALAQQARASTDFEKYNQVDTTGMVVSSTNNDLLNILIAINGDEKQKKQVQQLNTDTRITASGTSVFNRMREGEKRTFNYLYNTDRTEAEEYIDLMMPVLNEREQRAKTTQIQKAIGSGADASKWKEIGYSAISLLSNLGSGLAMLPATGNLFKNALSDDAEYQTLDTNSAWFSYVNTTEAIRSQVSQNIVERTGKELSADAYGLVMSGLDNITQMLVGAAIASAGGLATGAGAVQKIQSAVKSSQGFTLAVMSTGAMSGSLLEAKARGLNDVQAYAIGFASGMIELATEKFSIEALMQEPKNVISYVLKNGLAEGSEEIMSEIGNQIVDLLVSGDKAKYRKSIEKYQQLGYSASEAAGLASIDFFEDCLKAGAGGFLTGAVFSAVPASVDGIRRTVAKKSAQKTENTYNAYAHFRDAGEIGMTYEQAKQSYSGKATVKESEAYRQWAVGTNQSGIVDGEKINGGENLKGKVKGKRNSEKKNGGESILGEGANGTFAFRKKMLQSDSADTSLIEKRLTEKGMDAESAQQVAWTLRDVYDGVFESGEEMSTRKAADIAKSKEALDVFNELTGAQVEQKPLGALKKDIISAAAKYADQMREKQSVREELELDAGDVVVLENGGEKEVRGTGIGRYGKNAFISRYYDRENTNASLEEYREEFMEYYNAGMTGMSYDDIVKNTGYRSRVLGETQARAVIDAGKNDAKTEKRSSRHSGNASVYSKMESGLEESAESAQLDEKTKKALKQFAERNGTRIRIVKTLEGKNGIYNSDGTITLALDADKPLLTVAIHEAVHRMRETAPREYRRFRDFAYAEMKKENPDIYRETKADYDAAGQYEDNHGIMEEIAAQYAEKIDAEQFAKMLDDDRNMARKFLDILRDLWNDITSVFSKNSRERKEYDERLALFERMLHASERESAYMRRKKQTVESKTVSEKSALKGIDNDGKFIFKSNFPKGTERKDRGDKIVKLIQDVWSKKPITLKIWENGTIKKVQAYFNPELKPRSDITKIAYGNRKGNASRQRIMLDLADDLYFIAETSNYYRTKKAIDKPDNPAHDGVLMYHYFINDIIYEDYESDSKQKVRMVIDVKETKDGYFFYSFHVQDSPTDFIENKNGITRQTLDAAVAGENSGDDPNKSITDEYKNVNSQKSSLKKNFAASGDFDIQMGENGEMIVNFKPERRKEAASRRAEQKQRQKKEYGYYRTQEEMPNLDQAPEQDPAADISKDPNARPNRTQGDYAADRLREENRRLRQDLKLTDGEIPNSRELRELAKKITENYAGKLKQREIEARLQDIFRLLSKADEDLSDNLARKALDAIDSLAAEIAQNEIDAESPEAGLYSRMMDVMTQEAYVRVPKARDPVNSGRQMRLEESAAETQEIYRRQKRKVRIQIQPWMQEQFKAMGYDLRALRSHNNGRMLFTTQEKNGMTVTELYDRFQKEFGEAYFPTIEGDGKSVPVQKLVQISRVLDEVGALRMKNNGAFADAKNATAEYIRLSMLNVHPKTTYADRMQQKVDDAYMEKRRAVQAAKDEAQRKIENFVVQQRENAKRIRAQKEKNAKAARILQMGEKMKNRKNRGIAMSPIAIKNTLQELNRVYKELFGKTFATEEQIEKAQYIPQFLDEYDTKSIHMRDDTKEYLMAFKEDYEALKRDGVVSEDRRIEENIARLEKKHLGDLEQNDLDDIYDVMRFMYHALSNYKNVIGWAESREIEQLGAQSMENIRNAKSVAPEFINKHVYMNMLTPMRAVSYWTGYRDDDPLKISFEQLAKGEDNAASYRARAIRMFEEYITDEKFMNSISGKHAKLTSFTIHTDVGMKEIELTRGEMISLYLYLQNNESMKHIEKGGVVLPERKYYRKGDLYEAYRGSAVAIGKADVIKITSELDEREMEFARTIQKYYNGMSKDAINETSLKLVGYEIARTQNYAPLIVDDSFLKADFDALDQNGSVVNPGFTKERLGDSKPIRLMDANELLLRSIQQHSRYVGMSIPVRDFNKLWNATQTGWLYQDQNGKRFYSVNPDLQGYEHVQERYDEFNLKMREEDTREASYQRDARNIYNASLKQVLRSKYGMSAYEYIEEMIRDIQSPMKEKNKFVGRFFDKVIGNYAQAVLTANWGSAAKQYGALPAAAYTIGWRAVREGSKKFATIGKHIDMEKIEKYTGVLSAAAQGDSSPELAALKNRGKKTKLFDKLNWLQTTDVHVRKMLWIGCEYYVEQNSPELKKGTDDFYTEVARIFEKCMFETQNGSGVMMLSPVSRSNNQIVKSLHMFRSQAFQNINILFDASNRLLEKRNLRGTEEGEAEYRDALQSFGRAASSQIAQTVLTVAVDMLRSFIRFKNPEEPEEIAWTVGIGFLDEMTGGLPYFSVILDAAEAIFTGGNYYGSESVALSVINDIFNGVNTARNYFKSIADKEVREQKNMTPLKMAMDGGYNLFFKLAIPIATASGIPLQNIYKTVLDAGVSGMRIGQKLFNGGDTTFSRLIYEAATKPTSSSGAYYDILYKAFADGNRELYDFMNQCMLALGYKPTSIKSGITKRAEADPEFDYDKSLGFYAGVPRIKQKGDENDRYTVDDLNAEQYKKYRVRQGALYDELEKGIDFSGIGEDEIQDVYKNFENYSSEIALQEASGGAYISSRVWVNKADEMMRLGMTLPEYIRLYSKYGARVYSDNSKEIWESDIDFEVYLEAAKAKADMESTEEETKKEQVIEYIDALSVSDDEKDGLYLALGYAESGLDDCPWR